MELTSSTTLVAPKPKGIVDPATGQPIGSNDKYFGEINNELADKGFLVTSTDELINWAPHRLADVDDLWSRLLRRGNDADVDAALRRRAFRLCAARLTAPVRRDDRRRHADQQDGSGFAQGL